MTTKCKVVLMAVSTVLLPLSAWGQAGGGGPVGEAAQAAFGEAVKLVAAGESEKLVELVRRVPEVVKVTNERRQTLLHLAAKTGKPEVVRAVMSVSVGVDAADANKRTALHEAAGAGSADIVRTLALAGADVNARDAGGSTPLMMGALNGRLEAVNMLLSLPRVDKQAKTPGGQTALHAACTVRSPAWVKLSETYSATMPRGEDGRAAKGYPDWDLIGQSIRGMKDELVAPTAQELAARVTMARALIDAGLDVSAVAADGTTPLLFASMTDSRELCEMLLARGAKVDVTDNQGHTVVYDAAALGCVEILKLALDRGVDVNKANVFGWTPLMAGAILGKPEVIEVLLERKANYLASNEMGLTALHVAALNGHEFAVKLLLDRGLLPDAPAKGGVTPIRLAAAGGHNAVIELLLAKGAKIDPAAAGTGGPTDGAQLLNVAVMNGRVETAKLVLDKGFATIESKDPRGMTPLLLAASRGDEAMIAYLLEKKANVGAVDSSGLGALHLAATSRSLEAFKKLVSAGLSPGVAAEGSKVTPLHIAAAVGNVALVEGLISVKVGVNAQTFDGSTPLHAALLNKRSDVIKLLVAAGADVNLANTAGQTPMSLALNAGDWGMVALMTPKK